MYVCVCEGRREERGGKLCNTDGVYFKSVAVCCASECVCERGKGVEREEGNSVTCWCLFGDPHVWCPGTAAGGDLQGVHSRAADGDPAEGAAQGNTGGTEETVRGLCFSLCLALCHLL